jgi:parvulin-like peptidyl-prolyl isomerase
MLNTPPPPPPSNTRRVRAAHESKSATVRAAAAAPSRRQRSRWQREQQQQRMLYIGIGGLVALIALIFAGSVTYDNLVRANSVVAKVGSSSITAGQLLDEVRPQALGLDAQAKLAGGVDSQQIADYVDQQKRSLPQSVLNGMVDVQLTQQEADRRGISVSAAEIDDKQRATVADFQSSQNPTPAPTPDTGAASAPDASATPDTGGSAAQTTPAATPSVATTPTAVPTLTEADYGPALQQLLAQNGMNEQQLRQRLEESLLRDKVSTAVGQEQVAMTQQQIHARQIVVASPDLANDLLTQVQNGADFGQLAQQYSTDAATKNNGGDMGWFGKGVQSKTLEDAAFALQPGQTSDVIQDTTGFHIIQVLETDPNRPVPPDQLATQRQNAFNTWLTNQRSGSAVALSLDPSTINWILAKIGVRP